MKRSHPAVTYSKKQEKKDVAAGLFTHPGYNTALGLLGMHLHTRRRMYVVDQASL